MSGQEFSGLIAPACVIVEVVQASEPDESISGGLGIVLGGLGPWQERMLVQDIQMPF